MGFYDAFKDVLNVAQKADNIELYRQLLDLSAQALDLQAENAKLKEENAQLKKNKVDEERLVRHKQPYLTMRDDSQQIKYCSVCWDTSRKLVQMREMEESSYSWSDITFYCHNCKSNCHPDQQQ